MFGDAKPVIALKGLLPVNLHSRKAGVKTNTAIALIMSIICNNAAKKSSRIFFPAATRIAAARGIKKQKIAGSPKFARLFFPAARGESIKPSQMPNGNITANNSQKYQLTRLRPRNTNGAEKNKAMTV
jgi:hypothetical protein